MAAAQRMRLATLAAALPVCAFAADLDFRVTLDGAAIGSHRFRVERNADEMRVQSDARFTVRFLGVPVWRYAHRADERWDRGCLAALDADTATNGERVTVRARRDRARLVIERPTGREAHGSCEMTFAYWNPAILAARQLLNPQTGELTAVSVRALGEEPFPVRGRAVTARRHRIEGRDLSIDLWYADDAWVGLESRLAGGRTLRYELT
jgi:hypothetical protein